MPPLDDAWAPPSLVAGDPDALAAALSDIETLGLVTSGSLSVSGLATRLEALAPGVALKIRPKVPVLAVLTPSPLPLRRASGRWSPAKIELDPDFLAGAREAGDHTVLVIGEAPVDSAAWQRQTTRHQGSCDDVLAALGQGQARSLARMEPFLDHVDELLAKQYRTAMSERLPALREWLESKVKEGGPDVTQCATAYLDYLAPYEQAVKSEESARDATVLPRVYLQGHARIGHPEPALQAAESCASLLGRDPAQELRRPAVRSAEVVTNTLSLRWSELGTRLAALDELHAALEDSCQPRRRRYAEGDLAVIRQRLQQAGDIYRAAHRPGPDAAWIMAEDGFHVPGVGAVRQLAVFRDGDSSPAVEIIGLARGIRELALGGARCQGQPGGNPLAVAVIDVDDGALRHFDLLYEEELVCPGVD